MTSLAPEELDARAKVVVFNMLADACAHVNHAIESHPWWHEDTIAVNKRAVELAAELAAAVVE